MAATFNLQIVTPEREVFNGAIEQVILPGAESSFGVLANHAPLIAALDPGVLTITDAQGADSQMAVGGGFFQVVDNQAMVLADSAERGDEINVDRARESVERARGRLEGQLPTELKLQRDRAQSALQRAQTRLRVAGQ